MRGRPRGTVVGKHASKRPWKTDEGEFRTEESIRQSLKEIKMSEKDMPKMPEEYVADILDGTTSLEELEYTLDVATFRIVQGQYLKITKAKRLAQEESEELEQDEVEREKFKQNIVVVKKKRGRPKGWKATQQVNKIVKRKYVRKDQNAQGSRGGAQGTPLIDQKIIQLEADIATLRRAQEILQKP